MDRQCEAEVVADATAKELNLQSPSAFVISNGSDVAAEH